MRGYSDRINHAFTFAAKHYAPQAPRYAPHPYLAQPANVAVILLRHGADETTVVASVLHHLLEVCGGEQRHEMEHKVSAKFGPVVLGVACDAAAPRVGHNGEALDWRLRKREVMRQLATMEPRALDIRCADEIHECGAAISIVQRLGPEYLEPQGQAEGHEFIAWFDDLAAALGRRIDWPGHTLRDELRALTRQLAALANAR
jgi:hypothetical protein